MIKNDVISVPFDELDRSSIGTYVNLSEKLQGEFLIIRNENSDFYFLCSNDCDLESYCNEFGWFIISKGKFNDKLFIGIGLTDEDHLDGELYRVKNEATLQLWRDILNFAFVGDFVRSYFPYENHFKGELLLDRALCLYIHDYYPVSRYKNITTEAKRASNLILRFKEGENWALVAKLFSLAISRMSFYHGVDNPVLIPIPASTYERHRQRYARFCHRLAKYLKIEDGYRAILIKEDREQLKGTKSQDKISNLVFNKEYITGKDIFLIDDVVTTGQNFIQIKQKLIQLGAASVFGLFLGKTVFEEN